MKKSLLILSAIMVLVAFAVPAFAMEMYDPDQRLAKLAEEKASPLKVTGEFTFGFISSFDSDTSSVGFANAYIDLIWYPDEYNSVLMEIALTKEYSGSALINDKPGFSIPYFQLESDVGAYFGLPVGVINTMGLSSQYTNKYEVTGHSWERNRIRTAIDPLAWKFMLDFGMAQLTTMIGIGETTNNPNVPWNTGGPEEKGQFNDLGFYLFVPAVGPAEIEAWYMAQDDPDLKGRVGASAKADGIVGGLLGIAGGFVYDLRDDSSATAGDNFWAWAVGASVDYVGLALGAGIEGTDTATADRVWVDADYAFGGDFGVYATLALSLSDDGVDGGTLGATSAETYLGSEFGVYAYVGSAKFTLGYLYDADDADGYNYAYAVADNRYAPEGGLFLLGDIDF